MWGFVIIWKNKDMLLLTPIIDEELKSLEEKYKCVKTVFIRLEVVNDERVF